MALPVSGERGPTPRGAKREWNQQGGLTCADAIDFFLDGQFVQTGKRLAEEQADPSFENQVGITKGALDLIGRAFNYRGIGNAPMCGHGLPGPDGARLLRRVVANGEDEIHLRRSGL